MRVLNTGTEVEAAVADALVSVQSGILEFDWMLGCFLSVSRSYSWMNPDSNDFMTFL